MSNQTEVPIASRLQEWLNQSAATKNSQLQGFDEVRKNYSLMQSQVAEAAALYRQSSAAEREKIVKIMSKAEVQSRALLKGLNHLVHQRYKETNH